MSGESDSASSGSDSDTGYHSGEEVSSIDFWQVVREWVAQYRNSNNLIVYDAEFDASTVCYSESYQGDVESLRSDSSVGDSTVAEFCTSFMCDICNETPDAEQANWLFDRTEHGDSYLFSHDSSVTYHQCTARSCRRVVHTACIPPLQCAGTSRCLGDCAYVCTTCEASQSGQ